MASRCSERCSMTHAVRRTPIGDARRRWLRSALGGCRRRSCAARRSPRRRRRRRTAIAPRRPPSAPRIGCARCSGRPTRSPPRSGPCSPTCASSELERQISVEQLAKVERDREDVQRQAGRGRSEGGRARRDRRRAAAGRRSPARAALQDGPRRILAAAAERRRPAGARPRLSNASRRSTPSIAPG